jgi:hypothetical protein
MTACLAVALFGLPGRAELPATRVMPTSRVNDDRAGWRVYGTAGKGRHKKNRRDQCFHRWPLVMQSHPVYMGAVCLQRRWFTDAAVSQNEP